MLGFIFDRKPTVEAQVRNLIRRTNKRFFVILRHERAGVPTERLKDICFHTKIRVGI